MPCIYLTLVLGFLSFIQKKEPVTFNFWVPIFSCPRAVTTMKINQLELVAAIY